MSSINSDIAKFRRVVWANYKKNGRHDLPWRKNITPYKILVSEVMLQQTQVPRVIEKYNSFIKRFPTVRVLAAAPFKDVLKEWSGLGYNRRAKYLRDAAKVIVEKHKGYLPRDFAALFALPGIGNYTASAIRVFAFNQPDALLETNIRSAFIHHFRRERFSAKIADAEILPLAKKAAKGHDPRKWHWGLMDYGAYLKKSGVRNHKQSAHYTKQSKFEGSLRQVRGAILRALSEAKYREPFSAKGLGFAKEKIEKALASLEKDGLIVKDAGRLPAGRQGLIKKGKGKWRIA